MCYGPDTVYYMELSQEEIILKPKMQELSSLFMTHRLIVMYAPVKFSLNIFYFIKYTCLINYKLHIRS